MSSSIFPATVRNLSRQMMRHQKSLASAQRNRDQQRFVGVAVTSHFQNQQEGNKDLHVAGLLGLLAVASSAAWVADKNHMLGLPWSPDNMTISPEDVCSNLTIEDVLGQPESIARALGFGSRLSGGQVRLGGLGTYLETMSGTSTTGSNAAQYATQLMAQLGSPSVAIAASSQNLHLKKNEGGFSLVSPSGEMDDLVRLVNDATGEDPTAIGESIESGPKSFATQVTVLALVALWCQQNRNMIDQASCSKAEVLKLEDALTRLPISFGMTKKSREQCKRVAEKMLDKECCFVLGKGFAEPVAMEGASSFRAMSSIPAQGCCDTLLGHGRSKIRDGSAPVICIILDDDHAELMRKSATEAKARGADVMVITDKKYLADDLDEDPIILQQNGPMTALGAVLPLQLIAHELSLLK